MSKEEIARKIKSMREKAGLTQQKLAELVDKKQQTIASWEIGQSQPDADTLFLICDICNTDINEVFGIKSKNRTVSDEALHVARAFDNATDHEKEIILTVLGMANVIEPVIEPVKEEQSKDA